MPMRRWADLPTTEFNGLDPLTTIALLPVAAIEQHGPHLPVSVDTTINEGLVDRAASLMADQQPLVLRLPTQAIGKSNEHLAFAGTLSLSAETLIRLWTEIGESVYRAGIRKLLIFNSHGGQPQVMDIVSRDLRVRLGMLAVSCSWPGLGLPDDVADPDERVHGIHGGEIETAMMLHLAPKTVRMDKAMNFRSLSQDMVGEYRYLTPEGGIGFGWQAQDLNPHGVCGDATKARAETGAVIVDHVAAGLVALLREIAEFPVDRLQ